MPTGTASATASTIGMPAMTSRRVAREGERRAESGMLGADIIPSVVEKSKDSAASEELHLRRRAQRAGIEAPPAQVGHPFAGARTGQKHAARSHGADELEQPGQVGRGRRAVDRVSALERAQNARRAHA